MSEIAYRTRDPLALEEWHDWEEYIAEVQAARQELVEVVGRKAYIRRGNGYGSTRVVGFERFDSDKDGDLVHHGGCLIVSSKRGQHNGLVVPNLRRKAGKDFAEELKNYTLPSLHLVGMATFHVYEGPNGGVYMGGPSVRVWGDENSAMYAILPTPTWPVDRRVWEEIPLSEYYAAKEKYGEEQADADDS